MKIHKMLLILVLLLLQTMAFAHCPSSFKEEAACLMLEQNTIFIYDHKLEHNGPYKDFKKAVLVTIKNDKSENILFKKVARGIYKLLTPVTQKNLILTIELDKRKSELKLK